ncbi:MAG: nucleoside 2-deoxyribosyltransferase [Bacteroidetes bacterium]|nr:nucleoside 2-deoxyribosyltransferase [Bacteroidota bacterium]
MKFYFCGSIRGGRQLASDYQRIIEKLKQYGEVLTEHLGSDQEIETKERIMNDDQIHDRDMDWVRESDLVVAEVTIPSLGVGYEIGRAIELGKPVLCLFRSNAGFYLSAMIAGSDGVTVVHYENIEELQGPVKGFISEHAPRRTS